MYDTASERNEVIALDFRRIFTALGKKAWLVGLVALLCAAAVFLGTWLLVTPKYQSAVMFYVNNNSMALGDGASGITSSDISASQSLVSTYIVILQTWETMVDVINHSGVTRTYEEISKMVTAEAVADTQVFRVVVTSPDAQEAWQIAKAITRVLPQRISGVIEGTSAQMVDSALLPVKPCSPSYIKSALIGFALGLALTAGTILLKEIFDVSLHTAEDAEECCPVLTVLPEQENPDGYRQLWNRLRFCFADEKSCRILGITGLEPGGSAARNLAQAMARQGSRVLLMECDLGRSGKQPGLSDYLSAQNSLEGLIRRGEVENLHILGSGRGSPTPAALLGSERMEALLVRLGREYEGIVLDLPPVGRKEDVLAVACLADGILLTVRQKRSSRPALNRAVNRLEQTQARVLGTIFLRGGRKKRSGG